MKADFANAALLAFTLAAAALLATLPETGARARGAPRVVADAGPSGADFAVDARGFSVPARAYQRIVSLNTLSDHLLLELIEPERLIATTQYTRATHVRAWRFGARPAVADSDEIEAILSHTPDLAIVSRFANEAYMERLREAGVQVFDLGEMLGVQTTRASIRALGALLRVEQRAARLEREFVRKLEALEAALALQAPVPGIYLSIYTEHLSGGTLGTSYADVLHYGGVRDLAAEHGYRGFPQYSAEQLLALDPPLIVTHAGRAAAMRAHPQLRALSACGPNGRIIELPENELDDPGLGLAEAAALLREALAAPR